MLGVRAARYRRAFGGPARADFMTMTRKQSRTPAGIGNQQ